MSSSKTSIEWTDVTWNPTRGCSRKSTGCENCFAERIAARFSGPDMPYEGLATMGKNGPRWTGEVRFVPDALGKPLRWRKPRRVFTNSMSDLFHEKLSNEDIAAVFGVMAACPQHTFQVLTKRPERMREWFGWADTNDEYDPHDVILMHAAGHLHGEQWDTALEQSGLEQSLPEFENWPLPNVWLGVSVEDQATADERIPLLLRTPAAVRFISAEPLLGPIDLHPWLFAECHPACGWINGSPLREVPLGCHQCGGGGGDGLDWVIAGCESGPGARPMDEEWAKALKNQCVAANIPYFYKQAINLVGRKVSLPLLDGRQWAEFPESPR